MTPASLTNDGAAQGINNTNNNVSAGSVALLGNHMASRFAAPEGQIGTPTATAEPAQNQAALTQPHTSLSRFFGANRALSDISRQAVYSAHGDGIPAADRLP